ncbi:hypothetical protein CP03DC29_0728B, partial [Chlamydia psittaci 03DC29]
KQKKTNTFLVEVLQSTEVLTKHRQKSELHAYSSQSEDNQVRYAIKEPMLLTKKKDKLPKNKSESIVVGEDTSTYLQ